MEKLGTVALSSDILTKANIGLWAFELDDGSAPRMYADEAMMKLIGVDHEISPEETYHAWYDYIDSEHYGEVAEAVEKMTSGIHAEVQYPWHNPNGETWIVRCGGVRNYAYTKGIRIEGTHQNITALTHFEKRNLSDFLASLADNFLQVYFLDPYTGSFSSYAGNAFDGDEDRDYSQVNFYEDVAERSGSIVHPDDKPLIDKMYSKDNLIAVLESGQPAEFVVRWPTGIGSECVYMKNRLVPYNDDDGTKKLVIGILDVTSEKKSEKALEERNAYLEYFLNGFKSAYVVDLDTDTFEILHMDHDFRHVFKMDGSKDDMNRFIEEHIHPDDKDMMLKMSDSSHIKKLLEEKNEIIFTVREVYGSEERTMRVLIIRGAGSARAAVGFMDISDEIEKEKEYSHKLEAANRAKSSFLFNMSHDIRTPMNAIIGFNNMARKNINNPDKVADCLDKVESSSKHLLSLINDVLDMARVESGKVTCEYSPLCISKVAQDLVDMFKETSLKNLEFSTDFSEITHDCVMADELHLNRIITNILSNSVKYTNDGGKISFTIREKVNGARNSYEFTIADTGIGMSEEFLEHLFDEFSRETSATHSGIQGTGLGMAITRELVELLGGTIAVESKLGEGTTVTVCVDMDAVETSAINNESKESADVKVLSKKKILLVEDNELNREIAKDILEEYGVLIFEAENGKKAVEMMKESEEGKYDLILMDVQMPIMNGYEATKAIRALSNSYASSIPIIAMTANAFAEDVKNALDAGMNGHIAKPVDVSKLLQTLSNIL